MARSLCVSLAVLLAMRLVAHAQVVPDRLEPYALPAAAQNALEGLAAESDVLIFGEVHGTQEMPAVAAALLTPLTKLGYGVLALEVPADQEAPLTDWASGKSDSVPPFFTKFLEDGRGNVQVLSLIRTALAPPSGWKLICFDQPWPSAVYEAKKLGDILGSLPEARDTRAHPMQRDVDMAAKLARERARLAPDAKVLAICGGYHARTANREPSKLWPSFAAKLQSNQPSWRVRSVNVVPRSGSHCAIPYCGTCGPSRGEIHTIRVKEPPPAEAEAHALHEQAWNWELNLPRVAAATFLEPVSGADSEKSSPRRAAANPRAPHKSGNVPAATNAPVPQPPCAAPKRLGRRGMYRGN